MANEVAILIFSCDKNDEIWEANKHCLDKYWKTHPKTYIATETKKCEQYETLNFNYPLEKWSRRMRESLETIPTEKILFMSDDCFLRQNVDVRRFNYCSKLLDTEDISYINMEVSWDKKDIETEYKGLKLRNPEGSYQISLLCGLWKKEELLKVLDGDNDPWNIEMSNIRDNKGLKCYITAGKPIIDWGEKPFCPAGIFRGKWQSEVVPFFEKEGIKIDYNKKGFN